MRATAISITSKILRQTANECVSLVGYSFGASAALEVANQLSAAGRKVIFLVIVDGPFRTDELQGRLSFLREAARPHAITRKAVEFVSVSVDVTRRLAWAVAEPSYVGDDQSAPIRRALLAHLRGKALDKWIPQPCQAKGILLRTEEFGELNRERWLTLCPNLTCITLPGNHEDLLAGSSFTTIAATLAEAAGEANIAGER